MSTDDRAAWIAGMRQLLDILSADPSLPLPELAPRHPVTFYLTLATAPAPVMAALEAAIPAEFTPGTESVQPGDEYYYVLDGTIQGLKIRIKAPAGMVAVKRVTGQATTDITEWVRFPAEEPAESVNEDEGETR